MRNNQLATAFAIGILLLLMAAVAAGGERTSTKAVVPGGLNGNMDYSGGPNICGQCHPQSLDEWLSHGHSRKLALAFELGSMVNDVASGDRGHTTHARSAGIPLPAHDQDVYNWDNILMVIGASKHWKSRFVGLDGYLLTRGGKNQYNWATGEWVDYHADEEQKPFSCGTCHTTGYNPEGTAFATAFPGIVGDFAHINITCEACHGPGAAHVADPSDDNIVIDDSAAACGTCHTRGDDPNITLASGGFIRHHEQYPEHLNSPHYFIDCVSCHSPHVGRTAGLKVSDGQTEVCANCHADEITEYADSTMQLAGVTCQDCHMGRATKSARAAGPYEGDVWTHLFEINSEADYDMFNRDDGGNTTSAKYAISLEYACFRCHADADKAAFAAIGADGTAYHQLGVGRK